MSEQDKKKETIFAETFDGEVFGDWSLHLNRDNFDDLLEFAANRKASDITIQPDMVVMAEIGGQIVPITEKIISSAEVDDLVRYVYQEDGPAQLASGYDLDPAHEVRIKGVGQRRYRVNITNGRMIGGQGAQLTIRTLPSQPIEISKLNIEQAILDNWRPEQGLVFVTGPTGSGKSTLLSSGIRMLVERPDANEKILEYSRPIEYVYDGINMPSSVIHQVHAGKDLRPRIGDGDEGSIFAYCVRNALRRKPTIILIGEARDKATIEASVEAGLTGHLVYTTMHTIGVAETLRRAIIPFPEGSRRAMGVDIMESMRMIVTQLLLPKIGGGKVGCREFMVFGPKVRDRFLNEKDVDSWPRLARRLLAEQAAVGQTMQQAALKLLYDGQISKETYKRVASKGKS
ncbi:type IV pilus twitching motility protein PilT [Mesorhizobium sp. SP-1A]|uniref:type IV pilus twitching motility protein PilT n=1 Tax=Mesorhizobium sp. SP-1A TaxID=3077840 RepID=UPI0028F6CDC0|nr:ATPase, T2SS/T4P/T4SS family [Mesorhizobium sp. SP-1A]